MESNSEKTKAAGPLTRLPETGKSQTVDYKKYNRLILLKIEHSLNIIIPITIPLVILLVINDYLRQNTVILFIDSTITLTLILMTIFRHKIGNTMKIIVLAGLTLIAGFVSVVASGYAGAGLLTLLIGSILITGFLSKKTSILYAAALAAGVMGFITLVQLNVITYDISSPKFNPNLIPSWINLLIVFMISLLILVVVVNVIKKYFGINLHRTEEQLQVIDRLAFYDTLTGLPNKNKLLSDKGATLDNAGYLVLFSIDGYNLIDSIYGDEVTNEIILAISELLVEGKDRFLQYAKTDVNEFAFVWKKNRKADFLLFVSQSIEAVQTHQRITKWTRGIHFHLGYFECVDENGRMIEAYQKAKIALQEARANHAVLPVKYDEEMENRIREEYNLRHLVDRAIDKGEFTFVYQEKVDSETRQVVGVEALARWESDERGSVPPGVFIPIIEKSTQFSAFGNQSIRKVLQDYPALCAKYSPDIKVSINVSPQHLLSQSFINFIANDADLQHVRPENIIFEITEEMLIDNIDNALEVIKELKRYGFKISLDDFGSGYSSLRYLSRLIFDEVKVDKSFTDQITTDPKIVRIIEIIAALKDVYDFAVVIEGVETQEQFDMLRKIGHFLIQGYYFSKPQALE